MAGRPEPRQSAADYTIACICPMGVELAPVEAMLDEIHDPLPLSRDQNAYTLGKIGTHNIVIAVMPEIGNNAAATTATQLLNDFPLVRFGLLVGIGGGVPDEVNDVRLGDVVVSQPTDTSSGVVQYDFGKRVEGGRFQRTGWLNKPPAILSASVRKLDSQNRELGHQLVIRMSEMIQSNPRMKVEYTFPSTEPDRFFLSSYLHQGGLTCDGCDQKQCKIRPHRTINEPHIHHGVIGSANVVVKDSAVRDELKQDTKILCVEMEAAGLMNDFPCLVIRGICDYADSHKSKKWQPYAAAVAAAYMKELLSVIPYQQVVQIPREARMSDETQADTVDQDISASLAFSQMRDRQLDVKNEARHPDTCQWILNLECYRIWNTQPYGLLWIKGKPGAGKSTIMSFLYTMIQNRIGTNTDIRLEFFFSRRGTPLQHSFLGMLRSLLNQLLQNSRCCWDTVRVYYQQKCKEFGQQIGKWEWHEWELQLLFLESVMIAAQHQHISIFVDALDEAGQPAAQKIAAYFHKINDQVTTTSVPIKICISCRHYPIVSVVGGTEVCVEDHNHADITAYVRDRFNLIYQSLDNANLDLEQWRELQSDLIQRGRGVFRWVFMVMNIVERSITDGLTPEEVRLEIEELPEELSDVYEHIILHVINHRFRSQSFLLFQWICLAETPLTLKQIRYALGSAKIVPQSRHSRKIKCHETSGFIKADETMRQRVHTFSGGLLAVVNDQVQAGHQTVNEFMMQRGLALLAPFYIVTNNGPFAEQSTLSSTFEPSAVVYQCQSRLYWYCLKYLATETGYVETETEQRKRAKISDHPSFVEYAARHVFVHAEKAGQHRAQVLADQVELMQRAASSWVLTYRTFDGLSQRSQENYTSLLHLAASAGLNDVVGYLVKASGSCNQQDNAGRTALHFAARWGHKEVAESLIDLGAEVNQQADGGETPLTLAAANGHPGIINILAQQGAELDGVIGEDGNALQAASSAGNEQAVWALLEAGANANASERLNHDSALYAATCGGFEKIVQMLLESGANVNTRGGHYGSALLAASVFGHEKIVWMLLKSGANANTRGKSFHGSALYVASSRGYKKIVQMLLEFGANVNIRGGWYNSALKAASMGRHEQLVQILLNAGAIW